MEVDDRRFQPYSTPQWTTRGWGGVRTRSERLQKLWWWAWLAPEPHIWTKAYIHTYIYIFIYIQYEIWSISQRFFPIFSGDIRISLFSVLGANCKSRDWEYSLQCLGHMICDIQIWPWHRFISLWPVMERLAVDDFVGLAPYDQWQGSWYVCLLLLFFAWEKGEGEGEG